VKKVLYGPIGQQVCKDAKDSLGVDVLSLGASGFRIFVSRKPIHAADDVRGLRLRVPKSAVVGDCNRWHARLQS
jgi:TRAP-type C4-dicarboxylate transport system substrate-binding protein